MSMQTRGPQTDSERGVEELSRALDPRLSELMSAAGGMAGLNLLLLFGRDPTACDTAAGFALRLQRPVSEVNQALLRLSQIGILCASPGPGRSGHPSYWLSTEAPLATSLRRLVQAYTSSPAERRALLRHVCGEQPAMA